MSVTTATLFTVTALFVLANGDVGALSITDIPADEVHKAVAGAESAGAIAACVEMQDSTTETFN